MKFLLLISYICFFLFSSVYAQYTTESYITEKTLKQLNKDSTLTPMGKGILFVPSMLGTNRDPEFSIYKGSKFIKTEKTGKRIALDPGRYILYIGSGNVHSLVRIRVRVEEERTAVVRPVWSALIVKIVDQFGSEVKSSYQIITEDSKQLIGSATSADETKGEKSLVWIIRPDLYRVLKRGESPNSFKNFLTIRTTENEVTTLQIIMNSETQSLVGGGESIGDLTNLEESGNWSYKALLSGTFSLINDGTKDDTDSSTNLNLGSTLNTSAIYDTPENFSVNKLSIYENFIKQTDRDFLPTRDSFSLSSVFVHRMTEHIGPYVSLKIDTHFFTIKNDKEIILDKFLSPIIIQEGLGVNFEWKYQNKLHFNARTGWGFRQIISHESYTIFTDEVSGEYREKSETFTSRIGPEFNFLLTFNPFSIIELKEEFDALIPINSSEAIFFKSETTLSLWLSSFTTIEYFFSLEKESGNNDLKKYHSLSVQFFLNFL